MQKEIGARLRRAREEMGLTQSEVADDLQIARNSYTHIETGRNALAIEHLIKLTHILNRPVGYFLGLPDLPGLDAAESELIEMFRKLPPGLPREYALRQLKTWLEANQ